MDIQHARDQTIAFARQSLNAYQEVHLRVINAFLVTLDDALELVDIKKALPCSGCASFRSQAMPVRWPLAVEEIQHARTVTVPSISAPMSRK